MVCRTQRISMLQRLLRMHRRSTTAIAVVSLAATSMLLSGCNALSGFRDNWNYNSSWNSMMMKYRNEAWANKAWHRRKHQFCNQSYLHEFCEGFRAGYMDIADGGKGCTPAFPPRQYWNWKYQSAEGQAKVAAWYAGYPHGARAAEEDGIGNWTQIQTSTAVQQEYAEHGMLGPGQSPGMYPMPEAMPAGQAAARAATSGSPPGYAENLGNYNLNLRQNNSLNPAVQQPIIDGLNDSNLGTPDPFGSGVKQPFPPDVIK